MDIAQKIGRKWASFTQNTNGNFLRHIDGNLNNSNIENLQEVSAIDAMHNINDWVVDWTLPLSPAEIEFVHTNHQNFIHLLNE
tara:strand:+ start:2594 stop:2842 length:249 start_codon:yes stop_codon:yes gene_type:complete